MKYLTLIRHAKSSWENPDWEDLERPLNERGRKAVKIVGKYLKDTGPVPDLILCSPAKRARDTAARIGKILGYPIENMQVNDIIYTGNARQIRQFIARIGPEYKQVFLVGHEPVLSNLVRVLTGETLEKFPTCGVYRIAWDADSWDVPGSRRGQCEFFVYPKMLLAE